MHKKNPHQKTINALCRKLDKLDAKAAAIAAEQGSVAKAIIALGGEPSESVATVPPSASVAVAAE